MDVLIDLLSFQGRANRSRYFWHILLDDIAIFTFVFTLVVIGWVVGSPLFFIPSVGGLVAGFWAAVCVTVKRLHDLGRPAWHWWLLSVPFYNIYLGFTLLFSKGTVGPNRFGADPLEVPRSLPRER